MFAMAGKLSINQLASKRQGSYQSIS